MHRVSCHPSLRACTPSSCTVITYATLCAVVGDGGACWNVAVGKWTSEAGMCVRVYVGVYECAHGAVTTV